MTSSGDTSPSSLTPCGTPLGNHQAPKYGTLIPNRIFVGAIPLATDVELRQFFSSYGAVKDCKIIADRGGCSRGYGFVTFETQEDAEKILKKEPDSFIFKDKKLNIGPAIRKQAIPRLPYDSPVSPGPVMFSNGVPYTYQNGLAVFNPSEGYTVPTTPQMQRRMPEKNIFNQIQHPSYPAMVMAGQPSYAYAQPSYAAAYQSMQGMQSPPAAATPAQWAAAAAAAGQWRWAPQSPTAGWQYPAAAMQATMPAEMSLVYAQPQAAATHAHAHAYHQQHADMQELMEAQAAPAEYGYGGQFGGTTLC